MTNMKHLQYKKFPLSFLGIVIILMFIISSCTKDKPEQPDIDRLEKGILILNEGLFNMNNCSITYYNFRTGEVIPDIFLLKNKRGLGDTGSDLQLYGSKLYCVVNVSEQLEIIDARTCVSIKRLPLNGKQPRKLTFHQNKVYVSCYDGSVVKIDTATLAIDEIAYAGSNPEGICVANNKLYVANSGGLNFPDYGETVSVFDLNTFSHIKDIDVNPNPYTLLSDDQGYVYLISRGNYLDFPPTLQKIDSQTDEVVYHYSADLKITNMAISQNHAYFYHYDFNHSHSSGISRMNLYSENPDVTDFIKDASVIKTPYCIAIDPTNQDVYVADALQYTVNGEIYCFNTNGKKKLKFEAGINPAAIVFIP